MEHLDKLSAEELGRLFPIVLLPYDKKWKLAFTKEKKQLLSILGADIALRIEHIGSTAIDTIMSKPTLDILVEIPVLMNMNPLLIEKMKENGYHYILRKDLEAEPYMMFLKGYDEKNKCLLTYHIYMTPAGHSIWDRVVFRDYLINHPDTAKEYEKLKLTLSAKHKYDREKYTESKTDFVKRITDMAKNAPKRKYVPLDDFSKADIEKILKSKDINDLILLPLSVGMNYPEWKYAQDICVKLSAHEDDRVRANAVLGFAYIARTKGKLQKHLVKPIILRELRSNSQKGRIEDAIWDINYFLKWNLAFKSVKK